MRVRGGIVHASASVLIVPDVSTPGKWLLCCGNRKYVSILLRRVISN